ncbi:MAG: HNH endonuclease [Ruminococcus sp.]|nr:HNH endonuclease [Ruminococcus sp.]
MADFPRWKPQRSTLRKIGSSDFRVRYKALRNSSSGFISRKDVRDYIFERDGYKCYLCGSCNELQVDHIISVYNYAKSNCDEFDLLNSEDNLRTICAKCNRAKVP